MNTLKKYFLTGLVILLPVLLTTVIIGFIINVLTNPFVNTVATAYDHFGIFNKPFLLMSGKQVLFFMSRLTVLVGIVLIVFIVGFLGRVFLIKLIGDLGEYLIHRIPLVNKIYKSIHEVTHTIFSKKEDKSASSFSSVVLLPFPHSETLSLGLITRGDLPEDSDPEHRQYVSVFVPGTPNPAMGFMLMFPREELIPIDMTVEQALKFVVSIGVICPDFSASSSYQQDISGK